MRKATVTADTERARCCVVLTHGATTQRAEMQTQERKRSRLLF